MQTKLHSRLLAFTKTTSICLPRVFCTSSCSEMVDQQFNIWNGILDRLNRVENGTNSYSCNLKLQVDCTSANLSDVKLIHKRIVSSGHEKDKLIGDLLLQLFIKYEGLEDAQWCFDTMDDRSIFAWNFICQAYARHGHGSKTLILFQQMQQEAVNPNRLTFMAMVAACSCEPLLKEGRQMHARIKGSNFDSDVVLGNALISMYGKCRMSNDARKAFDEMHQQNETSWSVMIAVYKKQGKAKEALSLYHQMWGKAMIPNGFSYVSAFDACATEGALIEGKRIHTCLMSHLCDIDVFLGTAIVSMYGECGCPQVARMVFDGLPERNAITWNAMFTVYSQQVLCEEANWLFQQMKLEGVYWNEVTCVSILRMCTSLIEGKQVHMQIIHQTFEKNVIVATALVNMYSKYSSLKMAESVFEKVKVRDTILWTAMIGAYTQHGDGKKAIQLSEQMQQEGMLLDNVTIVNILEACGNVAALPKGKQAHTFLAHFGCIEDVIIATALIDMYGKCGRFEYSRKVFEEILLPNVISWNALMAAYVQHDHDRNAIQLFSEMQQKGVMADKVTLINILTACANQSSLLEGKCKCVHALHCGFEVDVVLATALVNMYSKCGDLEAALEMFDLMPKRNAIAWNAMIAACSQHGKGKEALQCFEQMQGEKILPNAATFVNVLSACSHTGLVDEGKNCWISMQLDYGLTPAEEHYNCAVDLLGRAGLLDEAENLIKKMPLQPSLVSQMTLLGSCRYQTDVDRGERVANRMFQFYPDYESPYIALSYLYSLVGREEDAENVWKRMKTKGYHELPDACYAAESMLGTLAW